MLPVKCGWAGPLDSSPSVTDNKKLILERAALPVDNRKRHSTPLWLESNTQLDSLSLFSASFSRGLSFEYP